MQRIITIDIETLPGERAIDGKNFWETDEEFRNTALDGNFGKLLCIGYAEQTETGLKHGCFGWNETAQTFESDERIALNEFWQFVKNFNQSRDLIIGHNILDFDLPFIIKRSFINGIRPTVKFNFARYRNAPIFDTMREWDCWAFRPSTSLDKLAVVLGLNSPKNSGITGANLYENYLAGNFREIYEYCMRDVKTTRNVWRKMNFTYPQEIALGI